MLPDELRRRAHTVAREEGISVGELIRRLLAESFRNRGSVAEEDPLFADVAVFAGEAPSDLAAEHDRHLYEDEA
jgi:hypothetical protein